MTMPSEGAKSLAEYRSSIMQLIAILPESLGDFLLTTPSLKALEKNFPKEEIKWILPDNLSEIAELVPLKAARVTHSMLKGNASIKPDLTICFPPAAKSYVFAWKLGGKIRIGYAHEQMWVPRVASKLFLTRRWICPSRLPIHELLAYGEILKLIDTPFEPVSPLVEIPETSSKEASEWLHAQGVAGSKKLVAVHLNSRWSENPLRHLKNETGISYLALFSRSEEEVSRRFIAECSHLNLLVPGPRKLATYTAFLKQSALLVSCDGGSVHIASAAKTPVLVFYPEKSFNYLISKWHPWDVPFQALPSAKPNLEKLTEQVEIFLQTP